MIQPTHPATGECLTVLQNVQALQITDQASLDWTGLLLKEVKAKASSAKKPAKKKPARKR